MLKKLYGFSKYIFKTLRKYWVCVLLSAIMVVGIFLSTRYADLYVVDGGIISFDLSTLYLIYVVPIYSIIYGVLSSVVLKKVWVPQLILYVITVVGFVVNNLVDREFDAVINILIMSVIPLLFSLVGTLITVFICRLTNK